MTNLRTWCAAMEHAPRCMITLSNVAYDVVETSHVPREVMRKVMDRLIALWQNDPAATAALGNPDTASDLLAEALDSAEQDLFCRGSEVTIDEPASHIVDRGTLEQFYVRNSYLARAIKPHIPGRPAAIIRLTPDRIKPKAEVRGRRPVAWITKTSKILEMEQQLLNENLSEEMATRVRDSLGLDHLTVTRELFEMRYPKGALAGSRTAAPTFVEGACREAYRSNVDRGDGWGRAVDLDKLDHTTGWPEVVHTPVTFTSAFELRSLGVVQSTRLCMPSRLQNACPRPWKPTDIDEVERYIA